MRTNLESTIIEKKDYDILIGKPFSDVTTVQYVFDGWTDEQQKRLYMSDLDFFEQESAASRVMPLSPIAKSIVRILTWDEVRSSGTWGEFVSPSVGTIFDLTYWHGQATPEDIESYFRSHGIALHRATPFIKPQKSLWQLIREKFAKNY
jgi:hypothetical protein